MDFSIQLSADYPDKSYGGDRVYRDMLDQAMLADRMGFDAVSLTEHHLINILMMPAPLTFAVKIAAHTERVKIMTSVVVLPIHDMRVYAGNDAFIPRGQYHWLDLGARISQELFGWRLDMVLASEGALPYVRAAALHPEVQGSDHCPASVDLDPAILD